jgi:hypothetical protein
MVCKGNCLSQKAIVLEVNYSDAITSYSQFSKKGAPQYFRLKIRMCRILGIYRIFAV